MYADCYANGWHDSLRTDVEGRGNMPFTVVELRAEVLAALAAAGDTATWTDLLLDEALRRALRAIDEFGPVYEASVTVATAGPEQDVSALPGLVEVTGIAWPWQAGRSFEEAAVRWRTLGEPGRVWLRTDAPSAGDLLRVRYRKAHTLEGLDDATAASLPSALRGTLALGGACYAAQLRERQAIENPALPAEAVERLRIWAAEVERAFFVDLVGRARGGSNPQWDAVGL